MDKKTGLAAMLIAIALPAFPRIMLQADLSTIGLAAEFTSEDLSGNESDGKILFSPFPDMGMNLFWEFATDDTEKKIHWFLGGGAGFSRGAHVNAAGGMNIGLAEFGKFRLELSNYLKVGRVVWLGNQSLYINTSCDILMMMKNRREFYFGQGISITSNTWSVKNDDNADSREENIHTSLHFLLGLRI